MKEKESLLSGWSDCVSPKWTGLEDRLRTAGSRPACLLLKPQRADGQGQARDRCSVNICGMNA